MTERRWLDVPYEQKDAARAAGARWDQPARRWYAPRAGMKELERWAAAPPIPTLLPGEDRSFGAGLFVDLVPRSCWFTNVRSCVDPRDWDRLRVMIYDRAGQRCEACGAIRDDHAGRYLEAHERWDYDDARSVQTLRRLVCLCTACHVTTHYGLANLRGKGGEAAAHLRFGASAGDDVSVGRDSCGADIWENQTTAGAGLDPIPLLPVEVHGGGTYTWSQ